MLAVNMRETKTSLSSLVAALEHGRKKEIIIARGGRPVARLLPVASAPKSASASPWLTEPLILVSRDRRICATAMHSFRHGRAERDTQDPRTDTKLRSPSR
jgi:antitoxin (DNA-binding transcriptional repressor) of toxin-antitoxin stability system